MENWIFHFVLQNRSIFKFFKFELRHVCQKIWFHITAPFSPAPASSQTKSNNNHQKQKKTAEVVGKCTFSPSDVLPYFSHKEFIDTMGLTSPTCFSTWTFILIKALSLEGNEFVDAMGLTSPTCFSTLLVAHIWGRAWEMKEGCGRLRKMKKGHNGKIGSRRWGGRWRGEESMRGSL